MKKLILTFSLLLISYIAPAQLVDEGDDPLTAGTFEKGLRFCEGTTVYRNLILVSNFGSSELNPLNKEGKGYIMSVGQDGKIKTFIPCDGSLSAPKGMVIVGKHLFIADVGKVVVYNLSDLQKRPQIITFPSEDVYVNDLVHLADIVLVSVTNTGRIYAINATNPDMVGGQNPKLIGTVPGANGMAVNGTMLYIASYNPEGAPNDENVIYAYDIFADKDSMKKLISNLKPGQYDGMAISENGSTLYFTSWGDGTDEGKPAIFSYALDGKSEPRILNFNADFKGPADISIKGGYIWIPDLPASKLYRLPL